MLDYSSVGKKNHVVNPSRRPKRLSQNSNTPYYKEIYALEIKEVFDVLLETKRPQLWKYSDWSEYTPGTLYQRVCWGCRFLLDHLDPVGKYATLREAIEISPVPIKEPIGLGIRFKRNYDPETLKHNPRFFLSKKVDDFKELCDIIDEYLKDETRTQPLDLPCLLITTDQQRIKDQYGTINSIIMNIDDKHIKVVKLI